MSGSYEKQVFADGSGSTTNAEGVPWRTVLNENEALAAAWAALRSRMQKPESDMPPVDEQEDTTSPRFQADDFWDQRGGV